jgi:hypothetical protein
VTPLELISFDCGEGRETCKEEEGEATGLTNQHRVLKPALCHHLVSSSVEIRRREDVSDLSQDGLNQH